MTASPFEKKGSLVGEHIARILDRELKHPSAKWVDYLRVAELIRVYMRGRL